MCAAAAEVALMSPSAIPTTPAPPSHWDLITTPGAAAPSNDSPFAHRLIADTETVYARLDKVGNSGSTSFSDYGRDLSGFLQQVEAKQLILDLRRNNGGNGDLRWGFLRHLAQYGQLQGPGSVYVFTGPRTYSASMMLINGMNSLFDVTFVGMPTGGVILFDKAWLKPVIVEHLLHREEIARAILSFCHGPNTYFYNFGRSVDR